MKLLSNVTRTVCICNRIDFDRYQARNLASFSQLFIARSTRLCNYVETAVGGTSAETTLDSLKKFTTFRSLIASLESEINSRFQAGLRFLPSHRVDFHRFKREFWSPSMKIDALVAWASIRSFIKGSIEALQLRRPLTEEDYMGLGKKRCRLSQEQRITVFSIFQKYVAYCREGSLWDDCDKLSFILQGLAKIESQNSADFEYLQYDKVYVDEVQDYTQCEIALFFRLSGAGGLFLAGDPAQAVVEGVEFRFEDIR
jgi:superfamily I DNA/RNA helicase